MKYRIASLVIVLLMSTSTVFGQGATKTLVKSFNLKGANIVLLDINTSEVQVKEWSSDFMRIQIEIKVENFNENILKSLITAGRYNLKGDIVNDNYHVTAPNVEKAVKIRGVELEDNVVYTIFVPEGTKVITANDAQVAMKE